MLDNISYEADVNIVCYTTSTFSGRILNQNIHFSNRILNNALKFDLEYVQL